MTMLRGPESAGTTNSPGTNIGSIPWERILRQAQEAERIGGPPVPDGASRPADLQVTGPDHIFAATRALAEGTGSVIMASGGTTGSPKPTHVPYHQALARLLPAWAPLRPGATLLNLFTPGRLWASHYYMQALAEHSRCHSLPAGPYPPQEVAAWLALFRRTNVSALAGTPTGLADLAAGVLAAGEELPVDTIIWMAEPWTPAKEETVRRAFPEAGFWANYGSVETYVIATNTPSCDLRTLHLMPDQLLETDPDGALLTRVGDGWTVPLTRYRLGDRIAPAACGCGRPRALQVEGRADDSVKLHGTLLSISEVLGVVTARAGVTEAQLILTRAPGDGHVIDRLTVHLTGQADPHDVRAAMLREFYSLALVVQRMPELLTVRRVGRLDRVDRTNKVPPMVWKEAPHEH